MHKILVFQSEIMREMHERAATAANAAEAYGPFVGAWWEVYLSEVIITAQREAEQFARGKYQQELDNMQAKYDSICGFYDALAKDYDAALAHIEVLTKPQVPAAPFNPFLRK